MNTEEAKFILRAHRADGRYVDSDPLFADALAQAEHTPELRAWLQTEHAFDHTIAAKLDGIAPPAGLRQSILIGSRASRLGRRWWQNPTWLGVAAALAVFFTLPFMWQRQSSAPDLTATALGELSLAQLSAGLHGHDVSAGVLALAGQLSTHAGPLNVGLALDADRMRNTGCQAFTFRGREVFEVCFQRDGAWYHLYVARADRGSARADAATPVVLEKNGYAAAVWAAGGQVFSLVTRDGVEALRRTL